MIKLISSSSDGSFYQVYKDNKRIGIIFKQRGLSGDRYRASIQNKGKDAASERVFDATHEALQWMENHMTDLL